MSYNVNLDEHTQTHTDTHTVSHTHAHTHSPILAMILWTGRREGASYSPTDARPLLCFSSSLKMKAEFSSLVMLMFGDWRNIYNQDIT